MKQLSTVSKPKYASTLNSHHKPSDDPMSQLWLVITLKGHGFDAYFNFDPIEVRTKQGNVFVLDITRSTGYNEFDDGQPVFRLYSQFKNLSDIITLFLDSDADDFDFNQSFANILFHTVLTANTFGVVSHPDEELASLENYVQRVNDMRLVNLVTEETVAIVKHEGITRYNALNSKML